MKTFLGIGSGPIQTGIFVPSAAGAGFSRIVLADVDEALVSAVRHSGDITVNTAGSDAVQTDTYSNIEIYNPLVADELKELEKLAATADAIATALPATAIYRNVAPWLTAAFQAEPNKRRYVYTAENSTTAAHELQQLVGTFPATYYLDTVIGKMSKVFSRNDCDLPPLAPGFDRGHLVEAFHEIYTSSAPGCDDLQLPGLYAKPDLLPFEEAKLYAHNAVHFVLGLHLQERGGTTMNEAACYPGLIALATAALIDECGAALCRKYANIDPFFQPDAYAAYAHDLVTRMISPVLKDLVDRVLRDVERKLSWNERVTGAIRLCLSQDVEPSRLLTAAEFAARGCFGPSRDAMACGLTQLWHDAPQQEIPPLLARILRNS